LLKKAKKATKRVDTNIDGFVDKKDKKSGPYGAFIPSVDGKGRLYTDLNVKNEDWQKINKGDKTDGMSPKAVKAYRKENPGSKLKTAVTGDPNQEVRMQSVESPSVPALRGSKICIILIALAHQTNQFARQEEGGNVNFNTLNNNYG
jgi:hypothetical protein